MRDWIEEVFARCVAADEDPAERCSPIRRREREVASLVARGFSNGDVAQLLDLIVLTVRTHRQRLMDKLELRNAAEITAQVRQIGANRQGRMPIWCVNSTRPGQPPSG